jgi:hypothetical protein
MASPLQMSNLSLSGSPPIQIQPSTPTYGTPPQPPIIPPYVAPEASFMNQNFTKGSEFDYSAFFSGFNGQYGPSGQESSQHIESSVTPAMDFDASIKSSIASTMPTYPAWDQMRMVEDIGTEFRW